ncbi:hypothetical protein DOE73_27090 [Paenibacillus dendritiformis]|nr:hypothetical protein DOE73_27090 [Paenibacillus dendritiformis]
MARYQRSEELAMMAMVLHCPGSRAHASNFRLHGLLQDLLYLHHFYNHSVYKAIFLLPFSPA